MTETIFYSTNVGIPGMSSQFLPSSTTASATAANNMQLVNMQQNYGPNNFGDQGVMIECITYLFLIYFCSFHLLDAN